MQSENENTMVVIQWVEAQSKKRAASMEEQYQERRGQGGDVCVWAAWTAQLSSKNGVDSQR